MPQALILADDLTGALDSAVAFAQRGLRTVAARRPSDLPAVLKLDPEVIAVATATREGSESDAVAAVREVARAFSNRPLRILFKKVDSRLKGHIAVETRAFAEAFGMRKALIAPAVPDFGRIVSEGKLLGHGITTPLPVAQRLAGTGLMVRAPDTATESDLNAVLKEWAEDVLLVGARGLAGALARHLTDAPVNGSLPVLRSPLLIAIGSRDQITLEQVDTVRNRRNLAQIAAPNGVFQPSAIRAGQSTLVAITQGAETVAGIIATRNFAENLAAAITATRPGTILASGGETADALLEQLSIGHLDIYGEVLPGMPISSALVDGRVVSIITKSGGFGTPEALIKVVDAAGV